MVPPPGYNNFHGIETVVPLNFEFCQYLTQKFNQYRLQKWQNTWAGRKLKRKFFAEELKSSRSTGNLQQKNIVTYIRIVQEPCDHHFMHLLSSAQLLKIRQFHLFLFGKKTLHINAWEMEERNLFIYHCI